MNRPDRIESLNAAVAAAALRLREAERRAARRDGPAAPGDLYALTGLGQDDLAWLVVRVHPDRADQRFVVPVDDHPLCGTPDVPLPDDQVARCGEGVWLSAGLLRDDHRVDVLNDESLRRVRAVVAALATGELLSDPERRADDDPSYQRWMVRVERARRKLDRRAEAAGTVLPFRLFNAEPPAWASAQPLALAAKPGGLSQQMEDADRAADAGVRHQSVALLGGTLRLAANEHGLMLAWEGGESSRPALSARGEGGSFDEVAWQPSHPPGVWTTGLFAWVKERIVLRVGDETLTVPR